VKATGINLSAFGVAHRPVVAVAHMERATEVHVTLYPESPFGGRTRLADPSDALFAQWRTGMLDLPRPIAVDVALDVSALAADAPTFLWQLTHRPLDFAFYGDAPLTDRVGEFGVRFRAMLAQSAFELGADIIEAMPRATIELFDFKGQYQGGGAHHGPNGWKADNRTKRGDKLLAKVLEEIGANPHQGAENISSEDLDAILCALTALAVQRGDGTISGTDLGAEIIARAARRADVPGPAAIGNLTPPKHAAVLDRPFWETLNITRHGA